MMRKSTHLLFIIFLVQFLDKQNQKMQVENKVIEIVGLFFLKRQFNRVYTQLRLDCK